MKRRRPYNPSRILASAMKSPAQTEVAQKLAKGTKRFRLCLKPASQHRLRSASSGVFSGNAVAYRRFFVPLVAFCEGYSVPG